MTKLLPSILIATCVAAGLSACGNQRYSPADVGFFGIEQPIGRPGQSIEVPPNLSYSKDNIDVACLIWEHTTPLASGSGSCDDSHAAATSTRTETSNRLNRAFADFYRSAGSTIDQRLKRDRVQNRIMGEADRRCELFKVHLNAMQSNTEFGAGAIATILGGIGALWSSETGARALAGAAGITSGVNAEFQKAYFQQMLVSVIASGIDMKRSEIANELGNKRLNGIDNYTLETAVADAIRYAGACTLVEGTKKAKERIAEAGVLGIHQIEEALDRQRVLGAKAYLATRLTEPTDARELSDFKAIKKIVADAETKSGPTKFAGSWMAWSIERGSPLTPYLHFKAEQTSLQGEFLAIAKKVDANATMAATDCDKWATAISSGFKDLCTSAVKLKDAWLEPFKQISPEPDDDEKRKTALAKYEIEFLSLSHEEMGKKNDINELSILRAKISAKAIEIEAFVSRMQAGLDTYRAAVKGIESIRANFCGQADNKDKKRVCQ